jgi:hypothetical protein
VGERYDGLLLGNLSTYRGHKTRWTCADPMPQLAITQPWPPQNFAPPAAAYLGLTVRRTSSQDLVAGYMKGQQLPRGSSCSA